jgi:hypothetical protein
MAARLKRRQQTEIAPALSWDRFIAPSADSSLIPDGTPVWVLRLSNVGGGTNAARVVLFTSDAIVRRPMGDAGRIEHGDRWELTLDPIDARPERAVRGYALVQGRDGLWHATTVDGRTASFRSEPDELGVFSTLGLRFPINAAPVEEPVRTERTAALQ